MKVVCGFPGVGKTKAAELLGWQDSDSSQFSWICEGERHPEFPGNYVAHLQESEGVVLASTHDIVRDALAEAEIPFILVYPSRYLKDTYLERYRARGSSEDFIMLLDKFWDEWIDEMASETRCEHRIVLKNGEYLSDKVSLVELMCGL
jgi:hypothetical protein